MLAAAGHRVIAPFIPSYLALTPNARAIDDFIRVVDALPLSETDMNKLYSVNAKRVFKL